MMTKIPFYIGSYSVASPWAGAPGAHGAGITRAVIDADSGLIEFGQSLGELNPSFLVRNDRQRLLWAITEPEFGGDVIGYDEDAAGALTLRGRVATGANAPCHVTVDWDRRLAFASHYHGGALALLSLGEGGEPRKSLSLAAPPSIARDQNRGAARSNVHASMPLGTDELLITDTGRDLVLLYRIVGERSATSLDLLDALPLPLGTGPRHLALHAATGAIYVSNQNSGGVSVIARTAGRDGPRLELLGMVASAGLGRDRCVPSEIAVHPTFDVVYMANRSDNSISVFSLESERGDLALRSSVDAMGSNPRYFRVSPGGRWLIVANQDSDDLTVFRVEDEGRSLTYTGTRFAVATPTAICF
jgi:6-phosphogluconolactonase